MSALGYSVRLAAGSLLATALAVNLAMAQPAEKPFEPTVGQDGKDVIWVPTPQALVDRMLDMAKVTPKDSLVDLGSGQVSHREQEVRRWRLLGLDVTVALHPTLRTAHQHCGWIAAIVLVAVAHAAAPVEQ